MNTLHKHETGGVSLLLVAVIVLGITTVAFGVLAIVSYTQYNAKNTDVNGQIKIAVVEAQKTQQEADEKKFADREKEPNRDFVGPDDYGRVSFKYPKTWSVYVATDPTKGGKYEAYLHPVTVPKVSETEQFALRVTIEERDYDQILEGYKSKVNSGDLSSAATTSQGIDGTRLDGNFSQNIRGSAVVYKIRDKTLIIRTDANTFKPDFDALIKTITFNQ